MASDIELRPHQKEAVAAATATFRDYARASVIAACGTGKTLIAARTTARIAPRGRVLVLLPTVDLLSQTIRSWRLAGRKGTTVAVCSARQALDHEPVGTDIPLTRPRRTDRPHRRRRDRPDPVDARGHGADAGGSGRASSPGAGRDGPPGRARHRGTPA